MLLVALVLAGLAGLVHVYIFWLESLAFDRPATQRVFGVAPADVETLQSLFYNQGFYNLFLAIGTAAGIGLTSGGNNDAGLAIVTFTTGSMLTAALVLITSNPKLARGAIVQGTLPALALLALLVRVVA